MRQFEIQWNGQSHTVWAEKINGVLWVHGDMGTLSYQPERRNYDQQSQGAIKEEIRAPMPGKIKKVLKAQGDKVSGGETVLVMEAMKMEFELKAPASGEVKQVSCSADDQVELDQLLVQLKLGKSAAKE